MRKIDLSSRLLSRAVWSRLFEQSAHLYRAQGDAFFLRMAELDALRGKAEYNTGSISTATQWALFSVAHALSPAVVAEVGTFIGKSTLSIAMGMDAAHVGSGEIHTCDMSNSMTLPTLTSTRVVQYPATGSTEMFTDLAADGFTNRVDFVHLDGRLQKSDLELLATLASPDLVLALDDFEGIEKGVANLIALRQTGSFKTQLLVPPPEAELLQRFGFWDHSSTALLLPAHLVRYTAQ
jgi:predicted O-methyltransferase YrrM